ncbi:MAG TPA: dockerin type I domain-containing protein [Candidatus Acidoferrales bacterium]|jgi:hypothetical protein|nr:dockerin type I domain-containing protein [Candidatus Acidoferrales bacterium]
MNNSSKVSSRIFRAAQVSVILMLTSGLSLGQQTITITSPTNGTRVTPGQTITIQVSTASGASFIAVQVVGEDIGFAPPLTAPPYSFTLTVPSNVVGPRNLTALGITSPENGVFSPSVVIDSETDAIATALHLNISRIFFQRSGQQMPLNVTATFTDGTSLDITKSSLISYSSADSSIATVDPNGRVTAVGPGVTMLNVNYGTLSVQLKVSVPNSIRGDLNGDGRVDKDDLNIILAALNTLSTGPHDARDLNGDGIINALDARILVTLCTSMGCATH